MTPAEAKQILDRYGSALARGVPDHGYARYESWLHHQRDVIVAAMKLELALSVVLGSNEEFQRQICSAVSYLPSFIPDDEAQRLNAIAEECRAVKTRNKSLSIDQRKSFGEVARFMTESSEKGMRLEADLYEFIAAVKQVDANDKLYWQKLLSLAGIAYSTDIERSIWEWIDHRFEARQQQTQRSGADALSTNAADETYQRAAWAESKAAVTLWLIAGLICAAFSSHGFWLQAILVFFPGIFIGSFLAASFFIPLWFLNSKIKRDWELFERKRWGLLIVGTLLRVCVLAAPIVGAVYYVRLLRWLLG